MSAYRTVFYDAVTVVARIPSIDSLVRERYKAFLIRRGGPKGAMMEMPDLPPMRLRVLTTVKGIRRLESMVPPAASYHIWTRETLSPSPLDR